jgi:hypothetical protein
MDHSPLYQLTAMMHGVDREFRAPSVPTTTPRRWTLYNKLPPNHFRFLVIEPAQDSSSPISCHLITATLDQAPTYIALSYCWGEHDHPQPIFVNGFRKTVKRNLYSALLWMRLQDGRSTVWVDAICINQSSNRDKSIQVSRMRDIYMKAFLVFAWIVDENEDGSSLQAAMAGLKRPTIPELGSDEERRAFLRSMSSPNAIFDPILKFMDKVVQAWLLNSRDASRPELNSEFLIRQFFEREHWEDWNAIIGLFDHKYWSRVWIMQELAVTKRVVLCHKSGMIAWAVFEQFVLVMIQNMQPLLRASLSRDKPKDESQIMEKLYRSCGKVIGPSSFHITYAKHGFCEFSSLLYNSKEIGATDPKDKIYALLGMAEDVAREALPIKYSKTVAEIYTEAMRYLYQDSSRFCHPLSWLTGRRLQRPVPHLLPSWVPDFRAGGYAYSKSSRWIYDEVESEGRPSRPLYSAGGPEISRAAIQHRFTADGRILILRGRLIDSIGTVDIEDWPDHGDAAEPIARWKLMAAVERPEPYRHNHSRHEAFWRTVLLDQKLPSLRFGRGFDDRLGARVSDTINMPPSNVREEEELVRKISAQPDDIKPRCFIITDSGFIGFAHWATRRGDKICVFRGAEMAHVIRETSTAGFVLIGEW